MKEKCNVPNGFRDEANGYTQNSSNETCLAVKEWWSPESFTSFYATTHSTDPVSVITPANPIEEKNKKDRGYFRYSGEKWIDAGLKVSWSQGAHAEAPLNDLAEWDHWHTSFEIRSHLVHIDFVSFLRMGPKTAYREYRVFSDRQEIGRGGGFAGFLGGNFRQMRNWPLAVEIENHLIYIRKPLQEWSGRLTKGEVKQENACLLLVKIHHPEE